MMANNNPKRIGIFGGTFNPVHNAHIYIAECFLENLGLDMLYIIPNSVPPLKDMGRVSGEDRIEMLKIAFEGNEKVFISDIELKREGVSYTCDTIAAIREMHPSDKLFLLTGDDWIDRFDKWKNYGYILENATLVVATRSGEDITEALDRLQDLSGFRPLLLGNSRLPLSSTEFRDNPQQSLIPKGVYEYIQKRGLYIK